MNENNVLTLVFKIEDSEKFANFHKKVLVVNKAEKDIAVAELGGFAFASSFNNLYDEVEKLNQEIEDLEGALDT